MYIPILCEMFSKALVISAENNFETTNPKINQKKKTLPQFSKEYREAHLKHKNIFKVWRQAGRPSEASHPAKQAVLQSRRNLQKIGRTDEAFAAITLHDDLIQTFETDRNKIYDKLKRSHGSHTHQNEIPFIEKLVGKDDSKNVLE